MGMWKSHTGFVFCHGILFHFCRCCMGRKKGTLRNFPIIRTWNRDAAVVAQLNEVVSSFHWVRITEKAGGENGENCIRE